MTFVRRLLKTTFVLGEGNFGLSGSNTMEISGLRTSAKVINAGGRSMGTAQIMIYGMAISQMSRLSTLGLVATATRKNTVTLAAGDDGQPPSVVFQGTIMNAWEDFTGAPSVPFHVIAQTGLDGALAPIIPTSIKGSTSVADLMAGLASQMGRGFINHGVTTTISNAYYGGGPMTQARRIVADTGIGWNGDEKGTIEIWPAGKSKGGAAVLITADSIMEGYPSWTPNGIMVKMVFTPSIGLGSLIDVRSTLKQATGQWIVYKIDHDLDSELPNGRWHSSILGHRIGDGPFVA